MYPQRVECLAEFERLSERGRVDLFYGDESGVTLEPYVLYVWRFADERMSLPAAKGGGVNCFALLSRDNRYLTQAWVAKAHALAPRRKIEQRNIPGVSRLARDLFREEYELSAAHDVVEQDCQPSSESLET